MAWFEHVHKKPTDRLIPYHPELLWNLHCQLILCKFLILFFLSRLSSLEGGIFLKICNHTELLFFGVVVIVVVLVWFVFYFIAPLDIVSLTPSL